MTDLLQTIITDSIVFINPTTLIYHFISTKFISYFPRWYF